MQPEPFGRYNILSRIGKGGMAEVFLASAPALDGGERVLALKRLLSPFNLDTQIISMMTDEARLSVWLTHPNIVQVLDFGQVDQSYYLAMEFVGGCDLCDLIRVPDGGIGRPLPPGTALHVMTRVAKALDFAHNRRGPDGNSLGIIHRDLSPHNVLLSTEGEIKLTDFGLARATISMHYSTADVIRGKFSYMPKEQATGRDIDQRIDIFGAGVTLYEALTGVKPYTSNTLAEQIYQLEQPVPPPSALVANLPEEVDHICLRAMAPEPDARYTTAKQLASDLERALARFSSAGREAEHLADLVSEFIGPEESSQFRTMHHMTQDEFPIVDGGVISAELEAVRQASGLGNGDVSFSEVASFLDDPGLDDYEDEGDTLTEEDELDVPTVESPAFPRRQSGYDPMQEESPEDLAATRVHDAAGVMVGGGNAAEAAASADDLDTQATVMAPEEGPKYARQALGLEPAPGNDDYPGQDDEQPTIQRSPSEMVAAFDRALKQREETRSASDRTRQRRRALIMGVALAGAVLFGGGIFIGWLMQRSPVTGKRHVAAARHPDASAPTTPRVAPLPVPVPVPAKAAAEVDAGAAAPEAKVAGKAKVKAPAARPRTRPRSRPRPRPRPRSRPRPRPGPRPAVAAPRPAPARAPASAKGKGFLSVNTDSAARVYIGDDPKAIAAPVRKRPLSAGIHRVRVFFEEEKTFSDTQWVSIKPGQTFTLYFSSPAQE